MVHIKIIDNFFYFFSHLIVFILFSSFLEWCPTSLPLNLFIFSHKDLVSFWLASLFVYLVVSILLFSLVQHYNNNKNHYYCYCKCDTQKKKDKSVGSFVLVAKGGSWLVGELCWRVAERRWSGGRELAIVHFKEGINAGIND